MGRKHKPVLKKKKVNKKRQQIHFANQALIKELIEKSKA